MPGGGLAASLQGSPQWMNDYVQNLVQKSRQLASERYQPYGASPEKNQAVKQEIDKLLESNKKGKFDIVPFSVTGSSKPIDISPFDLRHIIDNEGFARNLYESTTGHQASNEELGDLRTRAQKKFEYESTNSKEFMKILQESMGEGSEPFSQTQARNQKVQQSKQTLSSLQQKINPLEQEFSKLNEQRLPLVNKLEGINYVKSKSPGDPNGIAWERFNPTSEAERLKIEKQVKEIDENIVKNRQKIEPLIRQVQPAETQLKQLESEKPQRPFTPEYAIQRASIERQVNNLQKQRGQIAPMNEMHQRAIGMLERSFNDDTMKLATDELRKADQLSELRSVDHLVKSSLNGPSDEYMNKYINDYTKDIRRALTDESEEQYLEEIAPKINMSFAQMGAFHSGARAKALQDSLSKHRVKLHREIAHLTASARDKAMEHHELQKRREQSAAGLVGQSVKSEKEAHRHQSELLRQQEVTKHGLSQLDAAALGQVARAKQEQEQHEMDFQRQEHERQALHPHEQLARESALINGLPPPPMQSIGGNLQPAPAPPNLLTIGAGTLGALASGFAKPQHQQTYKEGGSVRKSYADGGHATQGDIGSEIRKIIQEQEQANKSRLSEARQHNPFQSWLHHVSNEMLSNPSENPMLNLGRGTQASFEHQNAMKERAANLYDKIQATKLNQYQVLAKFEHMNEQNALKRESIKAKNSLSMANLGETKRYHDLIANGRKSNDHEVPSLLDVGGNEFMPISSKKEKQELLKDKKASESVLKDLEGIKKLSEEYETHNKSLFISPRSPFIGGIASDIQGKFSNITNNKNMRKAAVAKAALDSKLEKFKINMESKMRKGVLPEGMRNFMEKKEVFPSSGEPLDVYNKKLEDLIEETRSMYDASKASLKSGVHISPYDLEIMKNKPSENLPSEEGQSNGGIVNMVDPDGNPLEVPQDQVEQALRLGATVAQ